MAGRSESTTAQPSIPSQETKVADSGVQRDSDRAFQIPPGLIQAAKQHKLIPLVGAGISRHAILPDGSSFPNWDKLLTELAKEAFHRHSLSKEDYDSIVGEGGLLKQGKHLMVAQTLCERLEKDYRTIIYRLFDPPNIRPGAIHKALFRLGTPLILTTNYDRLLEGAYPLVYPGSAGVYLHTDPELVQRKLQNWQEGEPPAIFKMHGCVNRPESIILSEGDYRDLYYRSPGYQTIVSAIVVTHTILMMGFSFADPDVRRFLASMRESFKHSAQTHYILLSEGSTTPIEESRNREDFNLETITYKASDKYPELVQFVEALAETVSAEPSSQPVQTRSARIIEKYINREHSELSNESISSKSARILAEG